MNKEELVKSLKCGIDNQEDYRLLSRLLLVYLDDDKIEKYIYESYNSQAKADIQELMSLDLSNLSKNIIADALFTPFTSNEGVTSHTSLCQMKLKPKMFNKVVLACHLTGTRLCNVHHKKLKELQNRIAVPYIILSKEWQDDFDENLESLSETELQRIYDLSYELCPTIGIAV